MLNLFKKEKELKDCCKMNLKFIVLFLLMALSASSQTKKETQDWIISKLAKYKETEYTGDKKAGLSASIKLTSIKFSDCDLVIVETNDGYRQDNNGNKKKFKSTITIKIPVAQLQEITYAEAKHQLKFETMLANISWSVNDPDFPSNNETTYESFVFFRVNLLSENDLANRLMKAFEHLKKTYCNKEKLKQEPF